MQDPSFFEMMANEMSLGTQFDTSTDMLYYFVREPYSGTATTEGFAKKVVITSELCDGQLCIDGSVKYDISYGDTCEIDIRPEYRLKCIKFS